MIYMDPVFRDSPYSELKLCMFMQQADYGGPCRQNKNGGGFIAIWKPKTLESDEHKPSKNYWTK